MPRGSSSHVVNKILIIRFSSIGDILLCQPVVRSLKKTFPSTEIHIITKAAFAEWARTLKGVDRVIEFDNTLATIISNLRVEDYDLVVDLHNNLRSRIVTTFLARKILRSHREVAKKWWSLLTREPRFKYPHRIYNYYAALDSLGIMYDGQGIDINFPRRDEKDYILVSLGGSAHTKRVPLRLATQLCQLMPEHRFVWIGGSDVDVRGTVIPDNCENLVSTLDIAQTIDKMAKAALVITGDTFTMHLSAALEKSMIVVWGSTHEDFGLAPLYRQGVSTHVRNVSNNNLSCRPCSTHGRTQCPLKHMRCLNDISPLILMNTVLELVSLNK